MTLLQSIILGIIQGLTEFLPISSSAHLVLIPHLLGWELSEAYIFPFDVLVQLGTLLAVIIYFWHDLWKIIKAFVSGLIDKKPFEDPDARMGWYLILATIPAVIAGMLLKDKVEAVFNDANSTAYFLFGTAALLVLAEVFGKRRRALEDLKWYDALWIGCFQAISIFPGISRSGATISGGMFRSFNRSAAARFSFLMSIPVMIGAAVVSISDVANLPEPSKFIPILLAGMLAALLVGYLSIHWLLGFISKRPFHVFAIYCVLLAVVVLVVGAVRANPVAPAATPTAEVLQTEVAALPAAELDAQNPLTVAYTPALDWLLPAMSACAGAFNDFSIVTHQLPAESLVQSADLVHLRWGAPNDLSTWSTQVGVDSLVLVVNPQNPLASLPREVVQSIAARDLKTWSDVYQKCPECFSAPPDDALSSSSINLNFYAAGDETQQLFINSVMSGRPVASAIALVIAGAAQMREAVADSSAAFGFLPSRFLTSDLKQVALTGVDASALQLPVLAIAAAEPTGNARDWLLCLQKALNP